MNLSLSYFFIFGIIASLTVGRFILFFKNSIDAEFFFWSWTILLAAYAVCVDLIDIQNSVFQVILYCILLLIFCITHKKSKRDIVAKKHSELNLVLKVLNEKIDQERVWISRQLHDDLNPNLILCKQELNKLTHLAGQNSELKESLTRAMTYVDSSYEDVRRIIRNTRSEVVDTVGLASSLDSLVVHYQSAFEKPHILFRHNLSDGLFLSKEETLSLYRIIQELIINVVKHAKASQLQISAFQNKSRFEFEIIDNGIGIDVSDPKVNGIGLIDVRQRVESLGGNLNIELGKNGKGTTIRFVIPIKA